MIHSTAIPALIVATIFTIGFPATGEEKPEDKQPSVVPVHEVKSERFKSVIKLKAVFESPSVQEVMVEPEEWSELVVRKVVPHGKRVKKGEVILAFETTSLKEKLSELEAEKRTARLTLQQSEGELRHLKQSTPLKLKAAAEARKQAEEALAYFEKVQRKQNEESARNALRSAEFSLEYAQEELKQLEKMYQEDNLTEETEEIVLKRTRRSVEAAERALANRRISTERALKVDIPRQHESLKAAAKAAVIDHELARAALPRALELKTREFDKAKRAHKKSARAYAELEKDLKKLTVKAPMDGYVFYGVVVDGKWTTATVAKKLRPGGTVTPKERILTVAQADGLSLQALVPENQLGMLRKAKQGVAIPVGFPAERLPAELTSLHYIAATGGYPAKIGVKSVPRHITPGMHADVSFVCYEANEALTVPNAAVHKDEEGHFVMLVKQGEADQRQGVSIGFTDGKKAVIKRGLNAGDQVRVD